jgi:hypothetical protein
VPTRRVPRFRNNPGRASSPNTHQRHRRMRVGSLDATLRTAVRSKATTRSVLPYKREAVPGRRGTAGTTFRNAYKDTASLHQIPREDVRRR